MPKMNFTRARQRDRQRSEPTPTAEICQSIAAETANIMAAMGKGRFSRAADKFMGVEPVKRIDPSSAEGRAIAAKLGL